MADISYNSRQVTVQCEHTAPIVYNHFPRHTVWLATIQIVGGVVMLIAGLVSFFSGTFIGVTYGSQGMEIVIPAIITGSFGIAAGKSKAICQITTTMIFSILTAMGSCGVTILMAQALVLINQLEDNPNPFISPRSTGGRGGYLVMLVVALIEAVVSIVLSSIACHFSCFCCKNCCCNYDLTTTEQILVSNAQQERQLLLISSSCTPGVELHPTAPMNYGPGQQMHQMHQPPQYSKFDV